LYLGKDKDIRRDKYFFVSETHKDIRRDKYSSYLSDAIDKSDSINKS